MSWCDATRQNSYRFHTFSMVRDIFACRAVSRRVLSSLSSVVSWSVVRRHNPPRVMDATRHFRQMCFYSFHFYTGAWLMARSPSGHFLIYYICQKITEDLLELILSLLSRSFIIELMKLNVFILQCTYIYLTISAAPAVKVIRWR